MKVLNGEEILKLPNLDEISFVESLYKARACSDGVNYMFILQLHITDFCNLSCSHCYGMDKKTEMLLKHFCSVVDSFFEFIEKHRLAARIHITGGEPFVHSNFFEMLDYLWENYFLKKYPFVVEILTNGTLISEKEVQKLKEYKEMIYEFQISIDGLEKAHDNIRGIGAWEKSLYSSKLLKKNNFRVSWSLVLSKNNYFDAIGVLHLAEKVGINRVTMSRLVPLGKNEDHAKQNALTQDEYKKIQKEIYDEASLLTERIREGMTETYLDMNRCDLWHLADLDYIKQQIEQVKVLPSYLVLGCACMIGKNYMVILPNGDMLACRRLPVVIGNVYREKIGDIWKNSVFLKNIRMRQTKMEGKCQECEFYKDKSLRNLCGGGGPCMAVAAGKSIYSPDPMCWKSY